MSEYETVGEHPMLIKQGTCRKCHIPLFGYEYKERDICGECDPMGRTKVKDFVVKAPNLSDERKTNILLNEIDSLKRENMILRRRLKRLQHVD